MHAKILFLILGIILGIGCGSLSIYSSEVAIFAAILTAAQGVLLAFHTYNLRKKVHTEKEGRPSFLYCVPLTICLTLGLLLGVLRIQFTEEPVSVVCEAACTKTGYVVSPTTFVHEYQTIVFRSDEDVSSYDILVRLPRYPTYEVGERVALTGVIRIPKPTFPHDSDRSFDYVSYLHTKHIGSEMFFPHVVEDDSLQSNHTFVNMLKSYKEVGRKILAQYVTDPESSLAVGVVLGDDGMPSELKDAFRAAGVSHIVVLSGFNIAILVMFIFWVTFFLPLVLRVFLALCAVTLFVLAVGAEASLVRASLMTLLALGALLIGRGYVARQALLLSLLAIMFYTPTTILHDVSLHLSFLATAGIVYVVPVLMEFVPVTIKKSFGELLVTTLATYVTTMPYVMYTFGSVSLYALIANMVIVPLVPALMLLSGVTIIFGLFSGALALVVGYLTSGIGHSIIVLAHVFESLPFSQIEIHISLGAMLTLYVGGIVLLIVTRNYRKRVQRNETLRTKTNEIISEVMTY